VALRDGDADRAAALAARSATDLDGIDALLLSRSARRLVEEAGGAEPVPPRERVILFTDMVASTELNVRAGDRTFVGLLEEHDRILRGRLRRHDGVQYTHTGDGHSAWFTSATSALACAFGMQEDLERASIGHAELPVQVRMGIAVGRPVDRGDNLFGLAVVAAARICGLAGPGQILVSDDVRQAGEDSCTFEAFGSHQLKGLPGNHLLHAALDLR
jgi:class 3 adenylate cyclase